MEKLNEKTVVAQLTDNEYVSVVLADGTLGRIKKADLIELATEERNGLLSKSMFSTLNSMLTPFKNTSSSTDINLLYMDCDTGLSSFVLVSAAINSPGAGFLMHFQRLAKGNMTAGSQLIYQLFLSMSGIISYRYGSPANSEMHYSKWIDLLT